MRHAVMSMIIKVLDVIVAVFIGPVNREKEHGQTMEELARRRKRYTLALCCVVLVAITMYTIVNRWQGL